MTNQPVPFEELTQGFYQSKDAGYIVSGLQRLNDWQASNMITITQKLEAQLHAFRNLRTILNKERKINEIEEIIFDYLLPTCLIIDEANSHLISRHLEVLSDWLDELEESDRNSIRAKIFERLQPYLNTPTPQAACWIISSIGYRSNEALSGLWKLIRDNNDIIGDIALSALSWLGIPKEDKDNVLRELHDRASRRYNSHLLWAIFRVGDKRSIPLIFKHWLLSKARQENVDLSLVFTVIRELLDVNDTDHEIQDSVWNETKKIVEREPKKLYWDFDVGHVVKSCNSPLVIPTLMRWHGQHTDWFENPDWARYLAQDRLGECVKPRQLDGWSQIDDPTIFEILKQDACLDTNFDGFASSQEWMKKESAWRTLLRAGYEEVLGWFDTAVANESGRFMRYKLMNFLACFRIEPLPNMVIRWITEIYNDPGTGDGREYAYRMAAQRIAYSTSTPEAFTQLLNFGFTYKSKVLMETTNAVASVALHLVNQGDYEIIDRLIKIVIESRTDQQRLAAVNALEIITQSTERHKWVLPHIESLLPLIYDRNREAIEKGLLLYTVGHLTEWPLPEKLKTDLLIWARQPDQWVGGGSLQCLAEHGHLEQYPDLIAEVLGLQRKDSQWHYILDEVRYEWAPYIIGFLYSKNPEAYTPALVSLLSQKDWQPTFQIIQWLYATHDKKTQSKIPVEIVNALIRRPYEHFSRIYGETEIFKLLSRLVPSTLASHPWKETVSSWIPDTRVALANALGEADLEVNDQGVCLATLEYLTGDSLYAVRRSAYRALSKQSMSYLYSLCESWLNSSVIARNNRAAEACGWVENWITREGQDGFEKLYDTCTSHPERSVRTAAHQTWEERRRRIWAREYLSRILDIKGGDNREILRTWCYGDALALIGDDECGETLRSHMVSKGLPPNIRYWIKYILEGLENNWKKTTQKWPEPWIDITGAIESGNGKLITTRDKGAEVQYSLWKRPADAPGSVHSWGGVLLGSFTYFLDTGKSILELEGGRRGDILLSWTSGNTATFVGVGPYPGIKESDQE